MEQSRNPSVEPTPTTTQRRSLKRLRITYWVLWVVVIVGLIGLMLAYGVPFAAPVV